jgi:predicted dinucleotide-binding enzyme
VVKAFNNIYALHLLEMGKPAGSLGRIALPVAGDDKAAKAVVLKLVEELGFDGIDAGGLDDSWRQQPGTPVYGTDLDADGVRRGLSTAKPERPPNFSARGGTSAPQAARPTAKASGNGASETRPS